MKMFRKNLRVMENIGLREEKRLIKLANDKNERASRGGSLPHIGALWDADEDDQVLLRVDQGQVRITN